MGRSPQALVFTPPRLGGSTPTTAGRRRFSPFFSRHPVHAAWPSRLFGDFRHERQPRRRPRFRGPGTVLIVADLEEASRSRTAACRGHQGQRRVPRRASGGLRGRDEPLSCFAVLIHPGSAAKDPGASRKLTAALGLVQRSGTGNRLPVAVIIIVLAGPLLVPASAGWAARPG